MKQTKWPRRLAVAIGRVTLPRALMLSTNDANYTSATLPEPAKWLISVREFVCSLQRLGCQCVPRGRQTEKQDAPILIRSALALRKYGESRRSQAQVGLRVDQRVELVGCEDEFPLLTLL